MVWCVCMYVCMHVFKQIHYPSIRSYAIEGKYLLKTHSSTRSRVFLCCANIKQRWNWYCMGADCMYAVASASASFPVTVSFSSFFRLRDFFDFDGISGRPALHIIQAFKHVRIHTYIHTCTYIPLNDSMSYCKWLNSFAKATPLSRRSFTVQIYKHTSIHRYIQTNIHT